MNQKTVIITGSTSGIGLGIAQVFAGAGWRVAINGIAKEEDIEEIRLDLERRSNSTVVYLKADLSTSTGCRQLIQDAQDKLGPIDVLINNAGIQHVEKTVTFPEDKWNQVLNLNLSAAFFTSQAVLPKMLANQWGRLIHIASVHSMVASKGKAAYVTAKHGLLGLSKVIALETAGTGVTSNCICPGFVLTPLVEKQIEAWGKEKNLSYEEAQKDFLFEKQPSHEFATSEQIGDLCLFLCSDSAAQITGIGLPIDGGWTAQ